MKCSFCGKKNTEVTKMMCSPKAAICDICIMECVNTLIYGDKTVRIKLTEPMSLLTREDLDVQTGC